MKKFYFFIAAMLLCVTSSVKAQTLDPEVVASYFENYKASKAYNFVAWTLNGEAMTPDYTDGSALNSNAADFKVDGVLMYQSLVAGMTDFYFQNDNLRHRTDRAQGLFNYGSGGRRLSIASLKKGMVIVIDGGQGGSYDYAASAPSNSDIVTDLTDSIHEAQVAVTDPETEEAGVADTYRYYRMNDDGRFDFNLNRMCFITAIAILVDDSAPEYLTTPVQKLASVYNDARTILVEPGTSSKGNPTTTYYTTDGSNPIYMVNTENIIRRDTTFLKDENGELILDEEGNPVYNEEDIVIVYEQVPAINPGTDSYGSDNAMEYVAELGDDAAFSISVGEDEDGDGIVTVKVASVTEDGVISDISSVNYTVGTIELNAPTLTLVGLDGEDRTYMLGWTNNTICGEEFLISYEADDELIEGAEVGALITAKDRISVTVRVNGYMDGNTEITVEAAGMSYSRKNTENAEAGVHDWDFVNIPEETLSQVKGEIVDYCFVVGAEGDTIKYATEDDVPGEIDNYETVYKNFGWWYDASKARAWLSAIVIKETDEEGVETVVETYYDEDKTGIFEGLTVDCPINANNNSCIALYTDGRGLYLMNKSTIAISDLQYGEYAILSTGAGTLCEAGSKTGMSKALGSGQYIYYIDTYTTPELPDAIEKVENVYSKNIANVYSIDGRLVRSKANVGTALNGLAKGIYIMNGKKYIIK